MILHDLFEKNASRNTKHGLGRKKKQHKITNISNPLATQFSIQFHDAKKAGKHYDLRIIDPKKQVAHSWAIPKSLPKPGEKRLAIRTNTHTKDYSLNFEGKLSSGYGEGTVKFHNKGIMKLEHADDHKIKFEIKNGNSSGNYAMINTKGDNWIVINRKKKHA